MWAFWIILLIFWTLVYCYKRRLNTTSRHPSVVLDEDGEIFGSSDLKSVDGLNVTSNSATAKTLPRGQLNDRDSDAEERSSVSSVSDNDSISAAGLDRDVSLLHHHQETVRVGFAQIIIESTRFNSVFHTLATGKSMTFDRQNCWRRFFAVGHIISVVFIIPCIILLSFMLLSMSQDVARRLSPHWPTFPDDSVKQNILFDDISYDRSRSPYVPALVPQIQAVSASSTSASVATTIVDDKIAPHHVIDSSEAGTETFVETLPSLPIFTPSTKAARYTTAYDTKWIPHMKLLLPGLNIDASQLLMLLFAVLICTLIHEAGHAIAAVVDDLSLESVGFALVVCFPIAFAKIDIDYVKPVNVTDNHGKSSKAREAEKADSRSSARKLRVLSAGVWCNVVFCIICWLVAATFSLIMLLLTSLGGSTGGVDSLGWTLQRDGVLVTNVSADSVHYSHLLPGDRITAINGCNIRSLDDLHRCVAVEPLGYCLRDDELRQIKVKAASGSLKSLLDNQQQHSHHKCCGTSPVALAAGLCFSRAEVYNQSFSEVQCVNIRRLLQFKLDNAMCYNSSAECAAGKLCYMPVLGRDEHLFVIDKYAVADYINHTTVVAAAGAQKEGSHFPHELQTEKIVVIGSVGDVLSAKFMPSFRNASVLAGRPSAATPLAELVEWIYAVCMHIQTFFNTCAGVSLAIALLNIVPCVHLDGDKIIQVIIIESLLGDTCERFASFISHAIIYTGTALVMTTVAVAFSSALLDSW